MSRLAYFKNVTPSVGLDATQNQMLNTLSGQIATKADASALTSGLAQKADSSAVTYALSVKADTSVVNSALALKADSSAVSTLSTALGQEVVARQNADALKADQVFVDGAIGNLITSIEAVQQTDTGLAQSIDNVSSNLLSKLDTSVFDARVVNEAVFFDSVSNSIVLQDANGTELNYVALGLVPA